MQDADQTPEDGQKSYVRKVTGREVRSRLRTHAIATTQGGGTATLKVHARHKDQSLFKVDGFVCRSLPYWYQKLRGVGTACCVNLPLEVPGSGPESVPDEMCSL